jgi:hypothetical protein
MINKQVTLTVNSGLINIEYKGVHAAELLSMLVNAIGSIILNVSDGDTDKRDMLVDGIIVLLKGELERI